VITARRATTTKNSLMTCGGTLMMHLQNIRDQKMKHESQNERATQALTIDPIDHATARRIVYNIKACIHSSIRCRLPLAAGEREGGEAAKKPFVGGGSLQQSSRAAWFCNLFHPKDNPFALIHHSSLLLICYLYILMLLKLSASSLSDMSTLNVNFPRPRESDQLDEIEEASRVSLSSYTKASSPK
jgi:hypothetical protein